MNFVSVHFCKVFNDDSVLSSGTQKVHSMQSHYISIVKNMVSVYYTPNKIILCVQYKLHVHFYTVKTDSRWVMMAEWLWGISYLFIISVTYFQEKASLDNLNVSLTLEPCQLQITKCMRTITLCLTEYILISCHGLSSNRNMEAATNVDPPFYVQLNMNTSVPWWCWKNKADSLGMDAYEASKNY